MNFQNNVSVIPSVVIASVAFAETMSPVIPLDPPGKLQSNRQAIDPIGKGYD